MMKKFDFKWSLVVGCLFALLITTSCGDDDESEPPRQQTVENEGEDGPYAFTGETLYDKVALNQSFSSFAYLLVRTGYDKRLSSYGTMTVFAPKNEGVQVYVNSLYDDENAATPHHGMSSNSIEGLPDSICLRIVKQHIVSTAALRMSDLTGMAGNKQTIRNDYGEEISIVSEDGTSQVRTLAANSDGTTVYNTARLLQADIESENGILFLVEEPICSNLDIESNRELIEPELPTKEDSLIILNSCYSSCSAFEQNQLHLESFRFSHQTVSPYDYAVSETMSSGYRVINNVNYILSHFSTSDRDKETQTYASQMCTLRAFTYYNMAMLWGRIILVTTPLTSLSDIEVMGMLTQSSQQEVYEFAYSDVCAALSNLPSEYESNSQYLFTRSAALMLKAEIELALKRNDDALASLQQVDTAELIFAFAHTEEPETQIYTSGHYQLFLREAKGEVEGLETEWQKLSAQPYGYWAALKRLGKAQEVTGCAEHELLMPIPDSVIAMNPNMTQNPGY